MMQKFGEWFVSNNTEITWWLIGWMSWCTLDHLAKGNLGWAAVDALVAYFNYYMWKTRQQ